MSARSERRLYGDGDDPHAVMEPSKEEKEEDRYVNSIR